MRKWNYWLIGVAVVISISLGTKQAPALTIDFEGLDDSTPVTNQYGGVTFLNATAITAGITLNEFEFPPHSGSNVVSDDGGPMTLTFTTPMADFGAYFTYLTPLTLSYYDALNNLEGTLTSAYSANMALSGDPGSSPNEFMGFTWTTGISSVVIAGDPAGGSFTMDDLTASPLSTAVPEPGTLLLLAIGILGLTGCKNKDCLRIFT